MHCVIVWLGSKHADGLLTVTAREKHMVVVLNVKRVRPNRIICVPGRQGLARIAVVVDGNGS
jgi:hypothetical protein